MIGFKQSGAADYIGWIKDGYLYYDIKTGSGQSGSPVMIFINGIKMAIGNFLVI
jgi:V8-like Glu-specific endopeptidase